MNMFKPIYIILFLFILFNLSSCTTKTSYSGKILNEEVFNYKGLNKKQLVINELGQPNYIDPIENKYYYYSEEKKVENFFNQKITNRIMLVFLFDNNENVVSVNNFNLDDQKDIQYIKDKTPNLIVKRGLIQKIFGGVGTIPRTAQ